MGATYYSGNTFDPHLDVVNAVEPTRVQATYIGREKSGCAGAAMSQPRWVPVDQFRACYYPTHEAMIAAYVDSGPTVAGLCRATLPGER